MQRFLILFLLASSSSVYVEPAQAGCVGGPQAPIRSRGGRHAYVHPVSVKPFQCVIQGLEKIGYPIRFIGGYGCRPLPTSNHPRGLAMDINQYARDLTTPRVPRAQATQIAWNCNVVHGAIWRNPDAGHFELRSLPRSARFQRRVIKR